jgi:AcrR family transcriptional regulator
MSRPARCSDVQNAILDAAATLYRRWGYRKTTIEDIAEEAAISRATVYLHYHGKDDIALAWCDRNSVARHDILRHIASLDAPALDRIERMLVERVMISFDMLQPYTESLDELLATLRPAMLAQRDCIHAHEASIFADVITQGNVRGECAIADTTHTARLLLLATNSLLPYSLSSRQLGERSEVESKARSLAILLANGMRYSNAPATCRE